MTQTVLQLRMIRVFGKDGSANEMATFHPVNP